MDSARILLREYFSITHLLTAARMARLGYEVEKLFKDAYNEELSLQDKAYALSAFYSATSFLEATINELFHDAAEQSSHARFSEFTDNQKLDLARYVTNRSDWNSFKTSKSQAYRRAGTYGNEILMKFQFACHCLGISELPETSDIFQKTRLLIDSRNKMTHFEPESVAVHDSEGPVTISDLMQRLNGLFEENPFSRAGNHILFPSLHLGHGGAEWSVKTALEFGNTFFGQIGMPIPYEHVLISCETR